MVSPPVHVRVVIIRFSLLFYISLTIQMEQLQSFFNGTLKLRYSSTPFSKKFPSWSVSDLSGHSPVVGPGPGPSVHFPDPLSVQLNAFVSQVRVPLSSANLFLG